VLSCNLSKDFHGNTYPNPDPSKNKENSAKTTQMKTNCTLLACFTLATCVIFPSAQANATNYLDAGTSLTYNLLSGDTLKITSGTYRGGIGLFTQNAVIWVGPNAVFKPAYFTTPNGHIINYGETRLSSFGSFDGFDLVNYGIVSITGGASMYDSWSSPQVWVNRLGGKIDISGSLSLGSNTRLENEGSISINGGFNLYSPTSTVINRGSLDVSGSLNMSAGTLTNENIITTQSFNGWGGQLNNTGALRPSNDMVISSGTTYVNECKLVTEKGLIVYGAFENRGILWVGKTNANTNELYVSGTFTNKASGKVKAAKLTNYSIITGAGYMYFSGDTYNSGTVGSAGYTLDTLKIFDATRTGSIFDIQYGTVHPNAVFRPQGVPDTLQLPSGCSNVYRNGMALPVRWNYFSARIQSGAPLLSWSAEYEPGMKFELERSFDQSVFTLIHTQTSEPSAAYTHTDRTVPAGHDMIYYRIKATATDGDVKYTETRMVKTGSGKSSAISIYPNPSTGPASLIYTTDKTQPLTVLVKNASGQQLSLRNFTARPGTNRFELEMLGNFQPGVYFIELLSGSESLGVERMVRK
jgi:hypothetical protein